MSTAPAAALALVILSVAGALPVLVLVGTRPPALPLAPLGGAILAALSSAACLVIGGPVVAWFALLSLAAAVVSVAHLRMGLFSRRFPPGGTADRHQGGPGLDAALPWIGGGAILAATVASLVALRAPAVGFDARTIWLLHARWFAAGHAVALSALRNPALPFAHSTYPPLVGGSVAVSWLVTGNHSDELGVVVIALLNACAVAAAAWGVVEVGRRCGRRVAAQHAHHAIPGRRVRLEAPAVTGIVVAALLVLIAFGVGGAFATNGYADLLWAASATGAVTFGLVLKGNDRNLAVAGLLLAVAGLTKNEGIATAMVIVVLVAVRAALRARHETPSEFPWRPVVTAVVGVGVLGVWPLLTVLLGAAPNVDVPGAGQDGLWLRARLTSDAMAQHLGVVAVALPIALVGALVLRRVRRSSDVGNDAWAWAALASGALLVGMVYVTGPGDVAFWLATSVHRTTFFPALCAWWIIGTWAVVGTAQGAVPAHVPTIGPDPPQTGELEAVLGQAVGALRGVPGPSAPVPTGAGGSVERHPAPVARGPAVDEQHTVVLHHR